MTTDPPRRRL